MKNDVIQMHILLVLSAVILEMEFTNRKDGMDMKYCCTEAEREGTCYHEFQKGKFHNMFWERDSLLLHDDNFRRLHLGELFKSVIPAYSEYGITEVNTVQWNEIYNKASELGGETKAVIEEINCWMEQIVQESDVVTILGI